MTDEQWPDIQFWTTLIEVTETPTGKALESLEINCTHVTGPYWIMEKVISAERKVAIGNIGFVNTHVVSSVMPLSVMNASAND